MAKKEDIGKWFEKQLKPHFVKFGLHKERMFYSFPDSFGSRGLIPPQPGEYMLLFPKGAALIELKASKKYKTFRSCMASMVRDSQYGWHKKWHLSGNISVFIFYSDVEKTIEVWNGEFIVKCRSEKKSLEVGGYRLKFHLTKDLSITDVANKICNELENILK